MEEKRKHKRLDLDVQIQLAAASSKFNTPSLCNFATKCPSRKFSCKVNVWQVLGKGKSASFSPFMYGSGHPYAEWSPPAKARAHLPLPGLAAGRGAAAPHQVAHCAA